MLYEDKKVLLLDMQSKLTGIDAKAKQENRSLTADEQSDFDKIANEATSLMAEMKQDEKRAAILTGIEDYSKVPHSVRTATREISSKPEGTSFRNFGEFFIEAIRNPGNSEFRTMSVADGSTGGILVPEQFRNEILAINPEDAIIRPRATVIEPGNPPDAPITMPSLAQGSNGAFAGVTFQWIGEGGTKPDTTPAMEEIKLEPKECAGTTIITDKLLRNAPAASTMLTNLFRSCKAAEEDYRFLRGDGVGKPLGILNATCKINIARNTASSVLYADVRSMMGRLLPSSWGSAVWIANITTLPFLVNLVDAAGNTLFIQGDITKSIPTTLMGLPLIWNGRTPTVGNEGDLMLVDPRYYIIKDGSGPAIASSEHVYFTTNKTVIKIFWNVDGQMWVKQALTLEDASTTVSPVVVLL